MGAKIDLKKPWAGRVDIESVAPNPGQPRNYFDQKALEETARSCKRRQIQALEKVRARLKEGRAL